MSWKLEINEMMIKKWLIFSFKLFYKIIDSFYVFLFFFGFIEAELTLWINFGIMCGITWYYWGLFGLHVNCHSTFIFSQTMKFFPERALVYHYGIQ